MALDLPKEAIRNLIATLSGIPASRVYWKGEAEKQIGPIAGKAGKITISVLTIGEGDGLEPRRDYDAGTDTLTEQWGATEEVTLTVRADNFLGLGKAYDLLRKVRFALNKWGGPSQAALNAADLAYIETPSITQLDYTVDNRDVSAASMDVRLAHMASDDPAAVPYIAKVTSKPGPTFTDAEVAALPVVDGIDKA